MQKIILKSLKIRNNGHLKTKPTLISEILDFRRNPAYGNFGLQKKPNWTGGCRRAKKYGEFVANEGALGKNGNFREELRLAQFLEISSSARVIAYY